MAILVKMMGQPSSYDQRFSRYEILPLLPKNGILSLSDAFVGMNYVNYQ